MRLKLRSTLLALFALSFALHLTGCASNDEAEETSGGEETFAEESSADFEEGSEVAAQDGEGAEEGGEGDLAESEDDLAEEVSDEESKDESTEVAEADEEKADAADGEAEDELALDDEEKAAPTEEQAVAQADGQDQNAASTEQPSDVAQTNPDDAALYADGQAPAEASDTVADPVDPSVNAYAPVDGDSSMMAASSGPSWVPVKKIRTEAFSVGGTSLNRVYIARGGDTAESVATKIYGSANRQNDLKKWNGWLGGREPKTGDKIYYQSPSNPQDQMMLTFYEDVGAQPSIYMSQVGDNIRQVSKNLLGENDSWKEVWATNMDVESKGEIPAGLNLRYWPSNVQMPNLAMNNPSANSMGQTNSMGGEGGSDMPQGMNGAGGMAGGGDPLNDPLAMNQEPPPLPNDPLQQSQQPMNDPLAQQPPPVQDFAQAAPEPPPAPVVEQAIPEPVPAPPAPAPVAQRPAEQFDAAATNEDADNMMLAGLVGIGLLAVGIIYALAKKRGARKVDLTQTTQVG